jgi:hypothetical protein
MLFFYPLFRLWHLAHRAQAACADVDGPHFAIDFEAAVLDVEYEAAA